MFEAIAYLGAASVAMGVGLIVYFNQREQRIKRLLRQTPTTRVCNVVDGAVVKIVGTLEYAQPPQEAPLSGWACAFFSVIVEKQHRNGRTVLGRQETGVEFLVRDESGTVRVSVSKHVSSALEKWRHFTGGEELDRYLKERNIRPFFKWNVTAREAMLTAGARVAVAGLVRWEQTSDGTRGYREAARRLTMYSSDSLPIFVSDDAKVFG
jgi:hypothetical protein